MHYFWMMKPFWIGEIRLDPKTISKIFSPSLLLSIATVTESGKKFSIIKINPDQHGKYEIA